MNQPEFPQLDVLLVGGGVSGLWLANLLHARGYRIALLEADALGCGQTLASQGMIHGGLKYALGGQLTAASEAIAAMPDRWRRCLSGAGEVDLRGLELLAEHNLLFASGSGLDRLTGFFASKLLHGRIRKLPEQEWPEILRGCGGRVYALDDLVISTPDLLQRLVEPIAHLVYRHRLTAAELSRQDQGWQINLSGRLLKTRRLVLTAGLGNGPLLEELGFETPRMQIRPLQQVIVRSPRLRPLYGHCLTGIAGAGSRQPRLTITSHPDRAGWLWYLGGRLADVGADMPETELITLARLELASCLPWLDLSDAVFETLPIDRAEAAHGGLRPEAASATVAGDTIVCWPTKLSLAPDLGDQVSAHLPDPGSQPQPELPLPTAQLGRPRWERPDAA